MSEEDIANAEACFTDTHDKASGYQAVLKSKAKWTDETSNLVILVTRRRRISSISSLRAGRGLS